MRALKPWLYFSEYPHLPKEITYEYQKTRQMGWDERLVMRSPVVDLIQEITSGLDDGVLPFNYPSVRGLRYRYSYVHQEVEQYVGRFACLYPQMILGIPSNDYIVWRVSEPEFLLDLDLRCYASLEDSTNEE